MPTIRLNATTNVASNHIDHLPRDVRGIDKTRRDDGSAVAELGPSGDMFKLHLKPAFHFGRRIGSEYAGSSFCLPCYQPAYSQFHLRHAQPR